MSNPSRQLAAEFVGTFSLVFAGTGAIIIDALTGGGVTHVGIGLTFGLIIMVMIYAFGHVSGAHFNPAVTLAFAVGRHFPWAQVPQYWVAQLAGGISASLVLRLLFGDVAHMGATLPAGSAGQSFGLELVLTLILMVVITSVATDTRAVGQAAAIAIGGTIGLEALFAGPISGASMNPARSLAPALVSGTWQDQWLYVAGPALGAVIGVSLYNWIRTGEQPRPSLEPVGSAKERDGHPVRAGSR
jgi:MIP family channel proteins